VRASAVNTSVKPFGTILPSATVPLTKYSCRYGELAVPWDEEYRRQKAEHIARFRAGRPYSSLSVPLSDPLGHFRVTGDIFSWISDDDRVLNVRNLRSAKSWRAHTPGREKISNNWIVAEELVAFWTVNTCYVRTLDGDQEKQFKYPRSSDFNEQTFASRKRTIAYAAPMSSGNILVYIWSFDTSRGRSFELDSSELAAVSSRNRYVFVHTRNSREGVTGPLVQKGHKFLRTSWVLSHLS
jgi:hypothetical protein